MAIKSLKSIKLPGLPDTYTIPQVDSAPTQGSNNAVSSGGVYDAIDEVNTDIADIHEDITDIHEDITNVYEGIPTTEPSTVNILNLEEIIYDKRLKPTGAIVDSTGQCVTGFIPIDTTKSNIAYTILNSTLTQRVCFVITRAVFFASDKTTVTSTTTVTTHNVLPIDSNASYVRLEVSQQYITPRQAMVEYADSESEISATYEPYTIVTTRTHGINYLDATLGQVVETLDDVSETVDEHSASISSLSPTVAENTRKITEISGTDTNIDTLADFRRGGAGSSGNFETRYSYRVATPLITNIPSEIKISIATGFRVYLNFFNSEGTRISGGWTNDGAVITSGSRVRIMIARQTEDTSEQADVETFCSKVTFSSTTSIKTIKDDIDALSDAVDNLSPPVNVLGQTWDWWITAHSIDAFGNAYIGYVDTEGYAGVLRRQPDGSMQYKRLEKLNDDDDHNGCATIVLDDGRILVMGSYGHTTNNHIVCWRSVEPYNIDNMESLSFNIPQDGNYTYKTCYSQIYKYDGKLFDFLRFGAVLKTDISVKAYGFACLISDDDGDTWTVYKVFNGTDAYNAMAHASDDERYLKVIVGANPAGESNTLVGCYIDLSTYKIYDLADTEIGEMIPLDSGTITDTSCAQKADMTSIIVQTTPTRMGRLFFVAKTPKAQTVFIYATSENNDQSDFVYKVHYNGTVVEIGHSGVGFGNTHYISGACFGKDTDTIYYSKATTSKADGNHELHKVKVVNNAVESDEIITEASMCILRPLFLGNGELATVVGNYNDQNSDGTYNGSFTAWELKPMFTRC